MRSILEFGAKPDTDLDHSAIIEKALETCGNLYFPKGTYKISRPIRLKSQCIFGDGPKQTAIRQTSREADAAVICAGGGFCRIEGLTFGFDDGIVDGSETTGQRVGLLTGNDGYLSWGSSVRNARINQCGTGIFSCEEKQAVSFSVTYDTLEISEFSYRGVDFIATNRTGNVFQNIYIFSKKYTVDTLFSLDTEESETTIQQLNLEATHCRYGARLRGVRAGAISGIHAECLFLEKADGAVLYVENSSIAIEGLSVYYTGLYHPESRLIELGDGIYDIGKDWADFKPENIGYLRIGTLHLKGMNDPWVPDRSSWPHRGLQWEEVKDFLMFYRRPNAKGPFRVQVDSYGWYTFEKDTDVYEKFSCRGEIEFLKKIHG